jgi:hypothetical protein
MNEGEGGISVDAENGKTDDHEVAGIVQEHLIKIAHEGHRGV